MSTAAHNPPVPLLRRLLHAMHNGDSAPDIALWNLACAHWLPGASALRIPDYISWLDRAAEQVLLETKRNYYRFLESPNEFGNSQARFCIVCLVTVLQEQFDVGYSLKWKGLSPDDPVPRAFGADASDLFIHAIIEGLGGTCGSLPVLYTAVGRRLGYPLRLVKAARHLFVRWDDPAGTVAFPEMSAVLMVERPGVLASSQTAQRALRGDWYVRIVAI